MAIVTSGKILVTGANGFVAMWVVDRLFKQGYAVRATVRSADKGVHLAKTFAAYGEKLEIVVVEDITAVRDFFYIIPTTKYVLTYLRAVRSIRRWKG